VDRPAGAARAAGTGPASGQASGSAVGVEGPGCTRCWPKKEWRCPPPGGCSAPAGGPCWPRWPWAKPTGSAWTPLVGLIGVPDIEVTRFEALVAYVLAGHGPSLVAAHGRRVAERRGNGIGRVASARRRFTFVYHGLRDGHIHSLAEAT
jgi:hypothetical protein